jgi:hypothetical protein
MAAHIVVARTTYLFKGGHVAGAGDPGSPVRTEPHPTRSFALPAPGRLETGKRDVENFEHEIGVGMGDAHRRLDAEGVTEQPSLAN